MNKIELPTGGEITIHYESDDYAYVQNKKAMQMIKPITFALRQHAGHYPAKCYRHPDSNTGASGAYDTERFKNESPNGSEYMYAKLFVDVAGYDSRNKPADDKYYDFIPCYARITNITHNGDIFNVQFEEITEGVITNPIQIAAWQKMKLEYPKFSYPDSRTG